MDGVRIGVGLEAGGEDLWCCFEGRGGEGARRGGRIVGGGGGEEKELVVEIYIGGFDLFLWKEYPQLSYFIQDR